jgi:hypothetical protein
MVLGGLIYRSELKHPERTGETASSETREGKLGQPVSSSSLLSTGSSKPANRAPAYVRGSDIDSATAARIEEVLKRHRRDPLAEKFPKSTLPLDRAVRASVLVALEPEKPDGILPEDFEFTETLSAFFQSNPHETIASIDSLLEAIPLDGSDDAVDSHRFLVRTLSNLGMDPDSRQRVKAALLKEAQRSSSPSEGALAFAAMLRMSPSKEWQAEVSQSFEKLHPGAELSEFVAMRLVAL